MLKRFSTNDNYTYKYVTSSLRGEILPYHFFRNLIFFFFIYNFKALSLTHYRKITKVISVYCSTITFSPIRRLSRLNFPSLASKLGIYMEARQTRVPGLINHVLVESKLQFTWELIERVSILYHEVSFEPWEPAY